MKTTLWALTTMIALAATPALAGDTHIRIGVFTPPGYTPSPHVMLPPPMTVYSPAPVYYAPPPCPRRHQEEAWAHRHHHGYNREFAWNNRGWGYGRD